MMKKILRKILAFRNYIIERPLLTSIGIFMAMMLPMIILSIRYGVYDLDDFMQQMLVQLHGMVLDIGLIGILLYWINMRGDRLKHIREHKLSIRDFKQWETDESVYRTVGNIKELNELHIYSIDLTDAYLFKAKLKGAKLSGSNLNAAKITNAELNECDLSKCELNHTDLTGSNLNDVILSHAYCNGSEFIDCYLTKANFENAFLIKANFKDAYLIEANFNRSYCTGANFENASLYKADFRGAKGLSVEQILKAKSHYLAKFDPDFRLKLKEANPSILLDETY